MNENIFNRARPYPDNGVALSQSQFVLSSPSPNPSPPRPNPIPKTKKTKKGPIGTDLAWADNKILWATTQQPTL